MDRLNNRCFLDAPTWHLECWTCDFWRRARWGARVPASRVRARAPSSCVPRYRVQPLAVAGEGEARRREERAHAVVAYALVLGPPPSATLAARPACDCGARILQAASCESCCVLHHLRPRRGLVVSDVVEGLLTTRRWSCHARPVRSTQGVSIGKDNIAYWYAWAILPAAQHLRRAADIWRLTPFASLPSSSPSPSRPPLTFCARTPRGVATHVPCLPSRPEWSRQCHRRARARRTSAATRRRRPRQRSR